MWYNIFFKSKLRQYACRNILLAGMVLGLCFLFVAAEPLQAAGAKKKATPMATMTGYLTEVKKDRVLIIDGQRFRLHKDARIANKAGISVTIDKLRMPLYVDFKFDPSVYYKGTQDVVPVITALKVSKRPL